MTRDARQYLILVLDKAMRRIRKRPKFETITSYYVNGQISDKDWRRCKAYFFTVSAKL